MCTTEIIQREDGTMKGRVCSSACHSHKPQSSTCGRHASFFLCLPPSVFFLLLLNVNVLPASIRSVKHPLHAMLVCFAIYSQWELIIGPDLLDLLNECNGSMTEPLACFFFCQLLQACCGGMFVCVQHPPHYTSTCRLNGDTDCWLG